MNYNIKEKSNSLKLGYLIGISILISLILLNHFIMINSSKKSEYDSRVINIAGRQRMLSQRITKSAFGIYMSESMKERDKYRRELEKSLNLWKTSHSSLILGSIELGLPGKNSNKIIELFDNLDNNFDKMLESSYQILNIGEDELNFEEELLPYLEELKKNEEIFLPIMDQIVFQYDFESKLKFSRAQILNYMLLFITLIVLVLECILIFIPMINDINHQMENLIINEKNLKKLFDVSPKIMCLVDPFNFKILRLNELALNTLGIKKDEQEHYKITNFIEEKYLRQISVEYVSKNSSILNEIEIELTDAKGEKTPMLMSISTIYYHKMKVFLIGLTNISEQKDQEHLLKYYATIDDMTGLMNRRSGMLLLEETFRLLKNKEFDLTICFIDINNVKKINAHSGHMQGDVYIKKISRIILNHIRSEDIAFRYGGDEIVICFKYITPKYAKMVLNKIELDIEALNQSSLEDYTLGISYGFTEYKDCYPTTVEEFINCADEKMYSSKNEKVNI